MKAPQNTLECSPTQTEVIEEILKRHTGEDQSGNIEIYKPKTNGTQFEALAMITFKTSNLKYMFKREASWHGRRTIPPKSSASPEHTQLNPRRILEAQT